MTETGHGSDVAAIATTATYDKPTRRSSSSTPRSARRGRTTSATRRSTARPRWCSRSSITDGVNHGVHAFYVPIRDGKDFLPGIGGEDDGLKGGLNGIDNGRLHFTGVRIPRTNLLNRYGDVDEDGVVHLADREPRPPLLHHARHARAGPGLARRRGHRGEQDRPDDRDHATATERRQFADGSRRRRGGPARLPAPPAPPAPAARHHLRDVVRARRVARRSSTACSAGEHDTDDDRQDLETLAASLKPFSTWQRSTPCRRRARPAAAPASSPRTASPSCAPTSTST